MKDSIIHDQLLHVSSCLLGSLKQSLANTIPDDLLRISGHAFSCHVPHGKPPASRQPARQPGRKLSLTPPSRADALNSHALHISSAPRCTGHPHACPLLGGSIPDCVRPNSGKLRRERAAALTHSGPPKRAFQLSPLTPEPENKLLDGFLMLGACNVDMPELAEVPNPVLPVGSTLCGPGCAMTDLLCTGRLGVPHLTILV
jgi:hypothetical protein